MVAENSSPLRLVGDANSAKRRQIIDGAREVFMDLGFDGASMGEIARSARVSKGTLHVTVTLPDGRTETFQAHFTTLDYGIYEIGWTAPPGVNYTLTDPDNDEYYGLFADSGWNNTSGEAFNNFDIRAYRLVNNTTGVIYNITRGPKNIVTYFPDSSGNPVDAVAYGPPVLTCIVQPSGDRILISSNSIEHISPPLTNTNASRSITIQRDGQGRIIAIFDPNAGSNGLPTVQYVYNQDTGNLIQVLKLVSTNTGVYTTNFYDYNSSTFPHYITSMENGDGITVARNFYDSSGRLVQVEDANGNFTTYIHSVTNTTELVVDRLGNTNSYLYDLNGNVLGQTNALGQITTMAYDANNNQTNKIVYLGTSKYSSNATYFDTILNLPTNSIDPLGNSNTYTYDGIGDLTSMTDARHNTTTNLYDLSGNLTNTSDALGHQTTNFYGGGMLVGSMNPVGTVTTNFYDVDQNLIGTSTSNLSGGGILSSNTYFYDANGNRLISTNWRRVGGTWAPAVTSYTYDSQNRLIQTMNPDGGVSTTVYDLAGRQVMTTDPLNHTTSYLYDYVGNLVQTTYADQTTSSSTFDANANRVTSTDQLGRVTTNVYDALNRVTATLYPDGTSNSTVYDGVGRVASNIDGLGTIAAYGYDVAGRRIATTNGYGTSVAMTTSNFYDANGNQTNVIDPLGRSTTNFFDSLNRQYQTFYPDGNSTGIDYDADGRKIAQTNQDSVVTLFGYDGTGRLISVTNAYGTADQIVTRYDYDEAGNEIHQIDALNRTNLYVYDGMGRRTYHTLPGTQTESFGYDVDGNLKFYTNFNGAILTNQYDPLNRLTSKTGPGGYQVGFTYTLTGQRQSMVDASGTNYYYYDCRDRLTNKTVLWLGGTSVILTNNYDANGNVISIVSSTGGGAVASYAYDPLSRLTNATPSFGSVNYGYDGVGNLATMVYGNSVTNSYQYDLLNRLTFLGVSNGTGQLATFNYQLGKTGNRTNLSETVAGTYLNYTWQYDHLYRLTNENISALGSAGYVLDAVGNRLTRTNSIANSSAQSFSYNTNDWLATDAYDSDGNTLINTNGTTIVGPNQYDVENHLTNYNSGVAVMVYNGDGLRVAEIVAGQTNFYLWDDRNPSGYAQVLEMWSGSTGSPPSLIGSYNYGLSLFSQKVPTAGTKNYYIADGRGSTRMLIGTGGLTNDLFTYDAYGNLIASNGPSDTAYLYCGQQMDTNIGLYLNRARYLNPNTGRFWTMDTYEGDQESPLSLHKYLYVGDNPVNCSDPSGMLVAITTTIGYQLDVFTGKTGGKVIYVGTAKGFINKIKSLPDASISAINFIGHGNPEVQGISDDNTPKEAIRLFANGFVFVTGDSINNIALPILLSDVLHGKMATGATINLDGCQTASPNFINPKLPNICQAISSVIPNVYVTGSTATTYITTPPSPLGNTHEPLTQRGYTGGQSVGLGMPIGDDFASLGFFDW